MGLDTILVQDSEPIATEVDREIVVLSLRAGRYFGLGEVGSEIWAMLAQPRRVAAIVEALAQRYEGDAATLQHDVTAFLQALIDRRLLRAVSGAPP